MITKKQKRDYIIKKLSDELIEAIDNRDKSLADVIRVQLDAVQFPNLFKLKRSILCKE